MAAMRTDLLKISAAGNLFTAAEKSILAIYFLFDYS